jgi:hypothetical protein
MLPKGQNWILMLALFLAVPAMRSPITVPRNRSRDDRETLARLWGAIGLAQENRAVQADPFSPTRFPPRTRFPPVFKTHRGIF